MPEIVFDGRKTTVEPGANLVEAGLKAGVPVPVFCYHKDLGAVGSCRVCAVTVTQAGKSRLAMACMTEAVDGMEVTTLDPASVRLRKYVLEWLMENHPHDCPICDEGGECQLQDLTIAAGHGIRRYRGAKRTFQNQFLGEFIVHEMNRCITCYRCSRFYQEYAGGRDFGVTGSRDRVYFGRFEEGPLESPFSGNLVELCPTGVFTDRLFRYKTRVWDLEIVPSICPHCSVGCNVHPGSRHRALQRVRVRENPEVNGAFLCDRGQFGHGYVMDPGRPREIRVSGEAAGWEDALGFAGGTLLDVARRHGASSIALLASTRVSVETHAALEALATGPLEDARISHFDDPEREPRALAALAALAAAGAAPLEQSDIARCDVLVIAGTSLVDEAPLAALAARQAARRGGRVMVLNAGERYLDSIGQRIVPVHPARLAEMLAAIARGVADADGAPSNADAAAVAAALRSAERPGLLLGTDLLDGPAIAAGAELAQALKRAGRTPRLGYVFPGPNAFAAAALSREASLAGILADLEAGRIRALVAVECDPAEWGSGAREALRKLELLVTLDHLPGPLADAAQVFLPTTATYESQGIFVNRAGRAQAFVPDRAPALSVIEMIDHATFPRTPRLAAPAGSARPAWWVLEMLRDRALGKPEARDVAGVRIALAMRQPFWRPLRDVAAGSHGSPLDVSALKLTAPRLAEFAAVKGTALFRTERVLGSEVLSGRSAPMRKMAGPPVAWLAPADARLLPAGDRVRIEAAGQTVELEARSLRTVPEGVVLVPRDVEWKSRIEQGTGVRVTAMAAEEARR
jgi:NADH-quinone oxidoreductase subunit G